MPLLDLDDPLAHWSEIDEIFFDSSLRKIFESETQRQAFREQWLGRYLEQDPGETFVALNAEGHVVGYIVGSLEHPMRSGRFADISYFTDFADLLDRYPGHLHINVRRDHRSAGLGARLISAFAQQARRAGRPGIHIVTGAQSRNIAFYERCGFFKLRTTFFNGNEAVFMGLEL